MLFSTDCRLAVRLLFKGGTSLSKGYGLISRFSEDIDITVFRDDLGQAASVGELETLSGKQRRAKLEAVKCACRDYIQGQLLRQLGEIARDAISQADIDPGLARLIVDEDDPTGRVCSSGIRAYRQGRIHTYDRQSRSNPARSLHSTPMKP